MWQAVMADSFEENRPAIRLLLVARSSCYILAALCRIGANMPMRKYRNFAG